MTFEMQVWDASRKLWSHALKLTRNDVALAEDIISEAVLNALTVKTRPDNIQSWLYGALRNRHVDRKRKANGRTKSADGPRLIFTDTLPDVRQDICTPEAILIAKQGLQRALAIHKSVRPRVNARVHGNAKLSPADVIYIRTTARNRPVKHLMAEFGVGFDTISRIRKGLSYAHVTECAT